MQAETSPRIWGGRGPPREPGASQSQSTIRKRPLGSGFWRWLVVNIPADVTELAEGAGSRGGDLPAGALQTCTDFAAPGYGGPCPPTGDHPHRYLFSVFAVKSEKLDVNPDSSGAVVGFNLHFNMLAKTAIMGLYKR